MDQRYQLLNVKPSFSFRPNQTNEKRKKYSRAFRLFLINHSAVFFLGCQWKKNKKVYGLKPNTSTKLSLYLLGWFKVEKNYDRPVFENWSCCEGFGCSPNAWNRVLFSTYILNMFLMRCAWRAHLPLFH